MPNPILLVTGTTLELSGLVYLVLTHFGLVPGALVVAPILFAAGFVAFLAGVGLAGHPLILFIIFAIGVTFLELVFRYNLLGLGTLASVYLPGGVSA